METKYTKGTWEITNGHITSNGESIAFTATLLGRIDETKLNGESWLDMRNRTESERINCENEKKANAKLIAAAPELLDALIGFFNTKYDPEWLYENKELIINAKNAIKKATE